MMRTLNWQLKAMCHNTPQGSFETRNQRSRMLAAIANQLYEGGYRHVETRTLKPKHVDYLVKLWLENNVSERTVANRLSVIRWWAKQVGRESVVHADNISYGLSTPQKYATIDKGKLLPIEILDQVKDVHVKMSLRLQAAFGLRREESIKIIVALADRTQEEVPHLFLKPSWCKGGRPRNIPITNPEQLTELQAAYDLVGRSQSAALIPRQRNYIQQRRRYDYECKRVGLSGMHGLRHKFAQRRYREITGHDAPILGGSAPSEIHGPAFDRISEELGHGRREIVASYCGRLVRRG